MENSIPPKHVVVQVVGFITENSAIWIVHRYGGRKRNCVSEHFWVREYYVSMMGNGEAAVRE